MFKNQVQPWPKEMLGHFSQKQAGSTEFPHLLESASLLQTILQQTASGIVVCDTRGQIVFINDVAKQLVAPQQDNLSVNTAAAVEGRVCYPSGEVMPLEEWSMSRALRGETVVQRDERICRPDGTFSDILVTAAPLRNLRQEIIGVVMTCTDITSRKQEEQAHQVATAILENSEDPIVGRSIDGIIITWNTGAERVYGYTAEEALGQSISMLIPPGYEGEHQQLLESVQRGERIISMESQRRCKNGRIVDIALTASPIRNEQGSIIGISVVGRDITRRKQLEQSLSDSEKRFRELADAMPQLVWTANPDGSVDYYNQRHKEFPGIGQDADGTWHWGPVVYPDDLQATVDAWQHAVQTGDLYEIEHRILQRDGGYRWYLSRGIPSRDSQGQIVKWYGTTTDFHAQKQAEEEVSTILNSISDGLLVLNDDWIITYFNPAAERLLAVSEPDVLGQSFFDVFPAASGTIFEEQYRWALRERQFTAFEGRYEAEPYANWYDVRVYPQKHGISIYFQVITERKRTEKSLRESEQRLRAIFENAALGIVEVDEQSRFVAVNSRVCQMLGYSQDELLQMTISDLTAPEDRALSDEMNARLIRGEVDIFDYEKRYLKRDGSPLWVHVTVSAVRASNGDILGAVGTVEDISVRREVDDKLRYQALLLENINDAVYSTDNALHITSWNKAAEQLYGWKFEELVGLGDMRQALKTEYPHISQDEVMRQFMEQGQWNGELIRARKDGSHVYVEVSAKRLFDRAGDPIGVLSIERDITERKQMEKALRQSEERYRKLFSNTHSMICVNKVIYDEQGKVVDWIYLDVNPQWVQKFGRASEEFVGRSAVEIFGAEAMAPSFARCQQVMESGQRHEYEGYFIWNDMSYISSSFPLSNDICVISTIDITSLKKTEKALRESEERFRTAVISAPLPIMIYNEDGEVVTVNEAWTSLTGYRKDELTTITEWTNRAYGENAEAVRSNIQRIFESNQASGQREFVFQTASGEYRTWVFSSELLGRDVQGRKLLITMALDITDRKKVEKELRESEARFRQLANSMPQLVWTARADGIIDYINERHQEYRGLKLMPSGTWDWAFAIHPEDAQPTAEAWQRAFQTGETYQAEHRMIRADGSPRWHLSRAVPIRNDEGRVIRWFGTATDIHEQKSTEERIALLQEVTANLSSVAMVSDINSVLLDKTLKAIGAHLGAVMMLTPDQTELVLMLAHGIPPKEYERFWRIPLHFRMPVTDAARTGEPVWIENQGDFATRYPSLISIVKETTHSQAIASIPLVVDNLVVGSFLVSFLHPIEFTQEERDFLKALAQQYAQTIGRAQLYEVVQRERDRLHAILDSMTEEVWFCDAQGNLVPANAAAAPGLGVTSTNQSPLAELLAQLEVYNLDGTPRTKDQTPILRSLHDGEVVTAEEEIVRHLKTGELRYRQVSSSPIHNETGEIIGAVAVVRDITDQKVAERQATELTVERERVRVLTKFVEHASHDFKTPISVINTSLYLLPRMEDPEKQVHHLDIIRKQVARLTSLIEDMMTMTNLDGTPILSFRPIDINRLVMDQRMAVLGAADDKGITVKLVQPEELPMIYADEEAMRRVLDELCRNAIQYTPPGGTVTLITRQQGGLVLLEIQDTGVGVSEEALPRIFERLYRADEARSADTGGTGLGLSIAKRIIELHGGRIEVSSVLGQGSTFRVLLPLHEDLPSG